MSRRAVKHFHFDYNVYNKVLRPAKRFR